MPSRLQAGLIILFWLITSGYIFHRDFYPRLWGDAPPAIRIDLSDEATQVVPARWTVHRNDTPIGKLVTRMHYDKEKDIFVFDSVYRDLQFTVHGLKCDIPDLTLTIAVDRDGDLREQRMDGKFVGKVMAGPVSVFSAEATAKIVGVVNNGMLTGTCRLESPLGELDQPLDPVPVPRGQVLNPLQPVNRLRDVRPGRRWVVYEMNPLGEAVLAMGQGLLKKHAGSQLLNMAPPSGERKSLIAEVESAPVTIERVDPIRPSEMIKAECWVIDYRGDGATAKTWVSIEDGRVLRQEASSQGEILRLERED